MASNSQMKVSVVVDLVGNLASKSRQFASAMTQMSTRSRAALSAMRGSLASTSAAIDSAGNKAIMGAVGAGYLFKNTFLDTARQAERFKLQMDALFGQQGSAKAMAWVKQNAKDTVLSLNDVIGATAKLKAYGANPFQLLPVLEDEAAMRGWSGEQFNNVVGAIGKMWADGKITDEQNDVLMDSGNGLSMIALLEQATGKSQAELKKLMSASKLGMDAIRLAIKQMSIEAAGASQRAMGGINGMISNAGDNWEDFQRRLMDAGVTDELKKQFKPILDGYDKADKSGSLDKAAQSGAQTMIRVIREVSAAARGLYSTFSQVVTVLDKGAQILGGWENTAKIIAGVWAANKMLRLGGAAFGVAQGAFNIGRGAWTLGAGSVKATRRGFNWLRGKRGTGAGGSGSVGGVQLPGLGAVQQVYVTNWPVAGLGGGVDIDSGSGKSRRKRGPGKGRARGRGLGRIVQPAAAAVEVLESMPGKKNAAAAVMRAGGRLVGRAVPVVGTLLAVADLASSDSAAEAGEAVGSAAGAVIGGALGSVVPVVGTAIGSVVGSYLGGWLGSQAGSWIDNNNAQPDAAAALTGIAGELANANNRGGEIKVKVELDDSLKLRSTQTASYGGLNLYTGGAPLF
ncbi:tape measure protein [Salmonella enterica subsp. enterica]|nr:tape measure protein [Salmonella enterica subsp. enterica serovar Essen]